MRHRYVQNLVGKQLGTKDRRATRRDILSHLSFCVTTLRLGFACFEKAGFQKQRSRSRGRSRTCKRAYDLVKIENRSSKRSYKLDGIGVRRIRTFPFLLFPFTTLSLMIQ